MNKSLIAVIIIIISLVAIITVALVLTGGVSVTCPPEYEMESGEEHVEVTCPGCTLSTGWNNVIYKGNTQNIASIPIINKVSMVWYFDGIDWPFYDPSYPELSTLTTLEKNKCYAFNVVSQTSW